MLGLLIKKEIRSHVLTYRFAMTLVLAFVLMLLGFSVMTAHYQGRMDAYSASASGRADQIAKIKQIKDQQERLGKLSELGIASGYKPALLSILSAGVENDLPVESHAGGWFSRSMDKTRFENPFLSVLMAPDFTYIVAVILSLLALIFSFDNICGEKEQQTLKLALSYSVPRHLILLSKWIGGYVVLICPVLLATGVALLIMNLQGCVQLDPGDGIRMVLMVGAALVYISLFYTAGIMISTLTHRAVTAMIIALFVWAAWVLVIPNISIVGAKLIVQVPTYNKIENEKNAIDEEIHLKIKAISKTMLGYGDKAKKLQEALEQENKQRKQELDEFYENKVAAQNRLCMMLSRLSPFAAFSYLSAALADTGIELFRKYRIADKRFHDDFRDYLDKRWKEYSEKKLKDDWLKPDELPAIIVNRSRLEDSINQASFDFTILAVLNILCFLTAFMCFLRYDVR